MTKVISNAVKTENIVGNASITLQFGDKDITLPGALRMRKDEVIRLQLFIPLLGTEIGRLEFTPRHVLVVDRMNKRYIEGNYNQLDFLRDNGITFYSLQALFWNELVMPNKQRVTANDAPRFAVDLSGTATYVPVVLDEGKMKYQWNASRKDHSLTSAVITYNSSSPGTSMLSWLYSDFVAVGKQMFPSNQSFSFMTSIDGSKQQGEIKISMREVKTSADWEAQTTLSAKYQRLEAEDIISQLGGVLNFAQ